jgi:hypothetical protein
VVAVGLAPMISVRGGGEQLAGVLQYARQIKLLRLNYATFDLLAILRRMDTHIEIDDLDVMCND